MAAKRKRGTRGSRGPAFSAPAPPYGPTIFAAIASADMKEMKAGRRVAATWLKATEKKVVEVRNALARLDSAMAKLRRR